MSGSEYLTMLRVLNHDLEFTNVGGVDEIDNNGCNNTGISKNAEDLIRKSVVHDARKRLTLY